MQARDRTFTRAQGNSFGGGVTFGGGEQNGISFQANASKFNANAKGTETTYDNTQIVATNNLTIKSGADTNLKGAQLAGKSVSADVGGNLNIETLQDQSSYESKSSSAGFNISVCVPPICAGTMVTGSVNVSNTSIDHNYKSAQGQSGIAAGKDGFDINVKGNTDLKGGAITSTATAEKNSLTTASLTTSDIQNTQNTKAQSSSMSAGYGGGSMASAVVSNVAANVMGNAVGGVGLPKNQNESSTTQSVISAGNIQIIGMGSKTIDAQSAANVALLTSRDPQIANGALTNTLSLQQAAEIEQNRQRAQENLVAAQMVGSVLDNVIGDVAATKGWKDGSMEKTVLHGLSGVVQAALGNTSALSGFAAGVVNEQLVDQMAKYLIDNGVLPINPDGSINQDFNDLLKAGTTLAGAGVGALTGGGKPVNIAAGGSIAGTATANNYLKHVDVEKISKQLKACGSDQACKDKAIEEAYRTSVVNDVELLNCKTTGNCDELKAAYREGYKDIAGMLNADIKPDDVSLVMSLENNAQTIIRNGLDQLRCKTQVCEDKANYIIGMAKGLGKISPAGLVAGTGVMAYELTTAIINNGLLETASSVASGVAGLPADLVAKLNSSDPQVRGEALVDALGLGTVTTSLSAKLGQMGYAAVVKQAEVKAAKAAEAVAIAKTRIENNATVDSTYAGGIPIRPRDGTVALGTAQIDTPIAQHLINAGVKVDRKSGLPTEITGGHNMDNFNSALQANGGQVIGAPVQVAPGIFQVEYRLPGTTGKNQLKTVYDGAKYSDQEMASMANEAASKGIYQWNKGGQTSTKEFVVVNGVKFEVPIASFRGQSYIPTVFPSGN